MAEWEARLERTEKNIEALSQEMRQERVERDREFQDLRTEHEQAFQELRAERERAFQEFRTEHDREMREIRETARENSQYVQVLTRNVDRLVLRSESQQNFFEQIVGEIREIRNDMRGMQAEIREIRNDMREVQVDIRGLQQENRRILEILFDRRDNGA